MSLAIHLLGPTRVERSGDEIPPPRGHKAWGLLTYLVRTPAPSSRERLGGLLFPEADDPMGSLRWTLSVLRRFLGDDVVLAGDPLRLSLPPGTFVDVDVLSRGSWVEAVALPGLGHELLDGMAFPSSPGFENWLENERRYVAGTTAGVLRQAALGRLGYGEPRIAVKHASELVRLEPFDQNAHALLVRCMRAVGDLEGAAQHVSACVELFRAELGVEPTLGLHEETAAAGEHGPRGTRRAAVLAQIETGEAVITAGAVEAGLERLRGAVAAARASSDRELLARSLIALGGALVHGARGTDVEGAAALHEGIALAEDVGADELAATGWREVSWVQFLRAEYDRAETSIGRAAAVAALDEELAWIDLILGSCRNDVGERVAAAGLLGSAVERLRLIGPSHPLALALTMLARVHLAARAVDESRTLLDEALDVVEVGRRRPFVRGPSRSGRRSISLRATSQPPRAASSMPSPSAVRSAIRAGRASRREVSGWWPQRGATSPEPSSCSRTPRASAAAYPTRISGSRSMGSMRCALSRSRTERRRRRGGSSSSSS